MSKVTAFIYSSSRSALSLYFEPLRYGWELEGFLWAIPLAGLASIAAAIYAYELGYIPTSLVVFGVLSVFVPSILVVVLGVLAFLIVSAKPFANSIRLKALEAVCWVIAGLSVAFMLSPIDSIPDFIPVLGELDDVLYLAAGFASTILALYARGRRTGALGASNNEE